MTRCIPTPKRVMKERPTPVELDLVTGAVPALKDIPFFSLLVPYDILVTKVQFDIVGLKERSGRLTLGIEYPDTRTSVETLPVKSGINLLPGAALKEGTKVSAVLDTDAENVWYAVTIKRL